MIFANKRMLLIIAPSRQQLKENIIGWGRVSQKVYRIEKPVFLFVDKNFIRL